MSGAQYASMGDQPCVTASEVSRRHGLSPSVLYRWRAVALKRDAQCAPRKDAAETRH
jgi:transposase-like protein